MKYLKERETKTSDEELRREGPALLLILKWGGELTTAGIFYFEKRQFFDSRKSEKNQKSKKFSDFQFFFLILS